MKKTFLQTVRDLKSKGYSENAIAQKMKLSISTLRTKIAEAKEAEFNKKNQK
jgi:orotate phosphoribosyltransferase-like protein